MPNRLRNKKARVSFFAFQDMITTVTGVLMVVMLLLSLDVTQRSMAAKAQPQNNAREQLRQERERLETNLETLRSKREELMALANRVFVIPDRDRSGKEPVLVVLSATNGWCSRLGQTNLIEFRTIGGRTEFGDVLRRWDASHDRIVFYVRPSGIAHFNACHRIAISHSFDVGYDAADEDRQYVLSSP